MKLLLVAVAALMALACGQYYGGAIPPASPPTSALVPWQGFPADQKPRPIVWLANYSPANGFTTGDGKIAAFCNKYVLGTTLPPNVSFEAVATWTNGTTASYRGISAAAALAAITSAQTEMQSSDCAAVQPLVIKGVRLGFFDFITDRGKAQMTSWLFSAPGMNGEVAYPAIVPTAFWSGGMLPRFSSGGAVMSADGRSLAYTFAGAPDIPGNCGADYRFVVVESFSAAAFALQAISHASPGEQVACPAIAQELTITVTLARPLGGRVFVDTEGYAVKVCPAVVARSC
jgi:hypothetical protein